MIGERSKERIANVVQLDLDYLLLTSKNEIHSHLTYSSSSLQQHILHVVTEMTVVLLQKAKHIIYLSVFLIL